MENQEKLRQLAEQIYDYVCATRLDNLTKEGLPGDPRKVGNKFDTLHPNAQHVYLSIAQWHLNNNNNSN